MEGHTHAIRKQDQNRNKRNNALWAAEQLGIKLHIIDIVEDYKDVLLEPKTWLWSEPESLPRLQGFHG